MTVRIFLKPDTLGIALANDTQNFNLFVITGFKLKDIIRHYIIFDRFNHETSVKETAP